VQDNGRGFDRTRRSEGLGLTSIATRIESAGGEWDVVSEDGAGTTLSLAVPLENAGEVAPPARLPV
jgi:signal transduction histidine kinase